MNDKESFPTCTNTCPITVISPNNLYWLIIIISSHEKSTDYAIAYDHLIQLGFIVDDATVIESIDEYWRKFTT